MSKVITKIELDEKIICSKVLLLDESLYSIRNKIKEKTKNINFQFLDVDGNRIEIKNENDLKLINALNDGKIKIISIENKELIKIIMNGKEFGYKNLFQKQNLDEVRNILKSEINQDFIFKDLKGINIQKENEKYFSIKDVLDNQSINLEFNNQLPVSEFDSKSFPGVKSNSQPSINQSGIDFSKYKEIKKEEFYLEDKKLYLYSEKKPELKKEGIYVYFYDEFDLNDYKEAYIVLFCGITGVGQTNSINAFFNVIKGIKLEDNYRFILINEITNKNYYFHKTKGIHLYYIKDYNNKPFILIDCQGYGSTERIQEDFKINNLLFFVFSNILDHINAVCFSFHAHVAHIDILYKFIFRDIKNLFSQDIIQNFIFLGNFASKDSFSGTPTFMLSLNYFDDTLNLNKRFDKDYWFVFDNKFIFDDEIECKINKKSYQQAINFYEKIKSLTQINTLENDENIRSLKLEKNNLNLIINEFIIEKDKLKEKEKLEKEFNLKIKDLENKKEISKLFKNKIEIENKINDINGRMNSTIKKIKNLYNENKRKEITKKIIENEKCYIDNLIMYVNEIRDMDKEIEEKLEEIKHIISI